jgi:hypothetical protein
MGVVKALATALALALAAFAEVAAGDAPSTQGKEEAQVVSMIDLIANKEKYHAKAVALVGYYRMGEELSAIYLSKEDAKRGVDKNGLWVSSDRQLLEKVDVRKYRGKYVAVWGVFNMKERIGQCSGQIEKVYRIRAWPK